MSYVVKEFLRFCNHIQFGGLNCRKTYYEKLNSFRKQCECKESTWARESHYVTVPIPPLCELLNNLAPTSKKKFFFFFEADPIQYSTVKPSPSLIHTSATPNK